MLNNCLSDELSGGLDCSSLPGVKTRGWSILQYYQGIGQLVGLFQKFPSQRRAARVI